MLARLLTWSVFYYAGRTLGQTVPVPLTFFTDRSCETPSNRTPAASIAVYTCVVSPGLISLHYDTVPCPNSDEPAQPFFFSDPACTDRDDGLNAFSTGSDSQCYSTYEQRGSRVAFMLSCEPDGVGGNNEESPTATVTIDVGPVVTGTNPNPGRGPTIEEEDNRTIKSVWEGLSRGTRIGIIAGAVGFVLIILLALRCCIKYARGGRSSPPPPSQQQPWGQGPPAPAMGQGRSSLPPPSQQQPWGQGPPAPRMGQGMDPDTAYTRLLENVSFAARAHVQSGLLVTGRMAGSKTGNVHGLDYSTVNLAINRQEDLEWTHKVGAAGELYVFEYLCGLGLPGFGFENWESSLVKWMRWHPEPWFYNSPFVNNGVRDGLSDFKYNDTTGWLTNFLAQHFDIHRHEQMVYYIEVKATMWDWDTPFYMSWRQKDHAENSSRMSAQIYVIFRLFNMGRGSQTGLDVYIDRIGLVNGGYLHFEESTVVDDDGNNVPGWKITPRR